MADSADHQAYRLIEQRQRESLGYSSQSQLDRESSPLAITPEAYGKTPHTTNSLPKSISDNSATQPGDPTTQPLSPSSQPVGNPLDQVLEAVGSNFPDLDKMPELPDFPRAIPKGKSRLLFNLDDSFNFALANARDYRSRKEDLYIAALNVALEHHQFEPRLFATTEATVTGNGEASDYAAAFTAAQTVGVRQKLPYGGEVVASGIARSVQQLNDAVTTGSSADLVLTANIPLLRGAGKVAQENLIQTERDLIYEVRNFERYRRAFLVQIASAYYNLINQRAQVINRFQSVRSFIFIRARTEALFDAGRPRVTQLDVARAKQSEFQARNDLTNTIEQYELAVDSFKILIGMNAEQALDMKTQYLKITPPSITDIEAVAIASRLRLDLQTTRDRVDDARRANKVAGNNLLPDLNLAASAAVHSNPAAKSFSPDSRNLDYAAGVVLDWPLDRVAEKNSYRISLINIERAKRTVEQSTDTVAVEVRSAVRRVRQQIYLVALQKKNIDLAQARKEFADIQFKNGKIDNRDYVDAENALVDAQNRFAQAVASLQIATLQYLRDTDQLRVDYTGKLIPPDLAQGVKTETQPLFSGPATKPSTQPSTQPSSLPSSPPPTLPAAPSLPPG